MSMGMCIRSILAMAALSFSVSIGGESINLEWVKHPRMNVMPDGTMVLTGKRADVTTKPFAVDAKKSYRFSLEVRRTPGSAPAKSYIGNWAMTNPTFRMQASMVKAIIRTDSKILVPGVKGSKSLTIRKPENWASDFKARRWGVVFNAKKDYSDLPNPTYHGIASAEVAGDVVKLTLQTPLKADYPAETPIRMHGNGDNMYGGWAGKPVPEEWTTLSWTVAGVSETGNTLDKWWHGTTYGAIRINANFDMEGSLEVRNVKAEVIGEAPVTIASTGKSPLMKLPMVDSVKIGDFDIQGSGESRSFTLPKFQARPGFIPVLRIRMGTFKDGFGGCCFAAKLSVSGTELLKDTAAGDERMLGKHPSFEMKSSFAGRQFNYWASGDSKIDMPYGPSCDAIDEDSISGDASVYLLDLRDVLSGNDSNTLTVTNIRFKRKPPVPLTLMVRDCEVGYISESIIPPKPSSQIPYEPLSMKCARGAWTLEVGKMGGFVLSDGKENRLIVESRLGMAAKAPDTVLASDKRVPAEPVEVKNQAFGPYGFRTEIRFPNSIILVRILKLEHTGRLQWQEEWRNNGKVIAGIPFRHHLSANIREPQIWISGDAQFSYAPTPVNNPTMVLVERHGAGRGFGITMESDMARLVCALRNLGDTGELFTPTLAIAPGMRQMMEFSVDPFMKGGYWDFINRLRERWHLNDHTAERPLFLGFVPNKMPKGKEEEYLKKTFGHLGPIAIAMKPWRSADRWIMLKDKYPKLPADAPRTVGKMKDLDLEAYLTYKHREEIDEYQRKTVEQIHRALPGIWAIQMTHPSMEAVYLPLEERWDYADCAIRDPEGKLYHLPHYDKSHLHWHSGDDGWGMGYYVPYGGTKYYDKLIDNIRKGMEIGFDGLYIDEFGFHFERVGYSRYTYDRWDGFSADLNPDGTVKHLKSDNAYTSVPFQHAAVEMVLGMGKYFLGNLGPGLRSMSTAPNMWFWEEYYRAGWTHLSQVPMILGHLRGNNLKKIFEGVKQAINTSNLYSPFAQSAQYLQADNFVCKQYPMTVVKLMPGGIVGRERLMTVKSGDFEWPGVADGAKATLFCYNSEGIQINKGATAQVTGGRIRLDVPKDGLVIAELQK